jgi:DICT domain-containing protein
MSLSELISGVEAHEKTLTVFNADRKTLETLRDQFHDRNLTVVGDETAAGQPSFAVLSEADEFLTAAALEDVLQSPEPAEQEPGFEADAHQPILDHLDETMFTSYDTAQMVAASREIEDRAWRVGTGALHAGFQTLSVLATQMDVYTQLVEKDLDVHAYAAPEGALPEHGTDLTIHVERAEEIRNSWFVVYDGAGVDVNKCALLAEEREPRTFYGFWTYDPDTVDWIVDHLESTYGLLASES